ncbi:MAG: MlaD family protein [Myxococcota bacterium]
MARRIDRWKLGLFAVLGMGLAFLALLWLGTAGFGGRTIEVVSYFNESVQGLDVGSAVKFRGVRIGHVSRIAIAPDRRHVEVASELDLGALERLGLGTTEAEALEGGILPLDLRVRLVSLGITGLKFLEVDIFDPATLSTAELPFEPPPNYLPATPSLLKSAEEGLTDLLNRFPELEQQAMNTLHSAEETLDSVRAAVEPFAHEEAGVKNLLLRLEEAVASLDAAASSFDRALQGTDVAATTEAIRVAAQAVADAASEATGLGSELRDDLVVVRELLQSLNAFAEVLERDPGALLRGRASENAPLMRGP